MMPSFVFSEVQLWSREGFEEAGVESFLLENA